MKKLFFTLTLAMLMGSIGLFAATANAAFHEPNMIMIPVSDCDNGTLQSTLCGLSDGPDPVD